MNSYKTLKNYLPITAWPLFVFAIHMFGQALGAYQFIPWLDTPMHFFGGAAITASSYYLFDYLEKRNELKTTSAVKILIALGFTALAATVWELAEYGGDLLLGTLMQPSIYDTMKDLTMGLLGAVVISLFKSRK